VPLRPAALFVGPVAAASPLEVLPRRSDERVRASHPIGNRDRVLSFVLPLIGNRPRFLLRPRVVGRESDAVEILLTRFQRPERHSTHRPPMALLLPVAAGRARDPVPAARLGESDIGDPETSASVRIGSAQTRS